MLITKVNYLQLNKRHFSYKHIFLYTSESVEQHYLAGIVDATLHTITDNLSYMNAIEDFLACMYYTTKKVQETKVDTMENLMDPEAQDIFAILKSLFNIPQSAIMTGVKTSQNNQKRTNSFNQIFMGLTELINNSDLSLDSIQKAWSTIKMNKAPAVAFGEHIQTIRAQLFNIVNYLINNEDFAWDPQKVTSNIISLLEPFHGGFAPLQVALIKEVCGKIFINNERRYPTLQTDYYLIMLEEFPVLQVFKFF